MFAPPVARTKLRPQPAARRSGSLATRQLWDAALGPGRLSTAVQAKLAVGALDDWHDVTPVDRVYAKDCSTVTDIYGAGSAPEVGRHPPSEIVKGCGEK